MMKYWTGKAPRRCDVCEGMLTSKDDTAQDAFTDGRLHIGTWGILCDGCHETFGVGHGVGKGQRYVRQQDGRWMKVAG